MTAAQFNGVREMIEKKEGLFIKNLMGKRVNFAARSVISPDPYINGNEVGVSPCLAMKLSLPNAVTANNLKSSIKLVMNGPEHYPGAIAIEDPCGRLISLSSKNHMERVTIAKSLLASKTICIHGKLRKHGKIVYRHLQNRDMVLTNRQPTLHKPGIIAQYVRVLENERTIRIHYVNCSALNADFDGDEINLHLPQDIQCQGECATIVQADHQFVIPTNGKPIRALIQDQIVAGTLLTKKDTFFELPVFMQLFYFGTRVTGITEKVNRVCTSAIIFPVKLWTGKQLITSIIEFFLGEILTITFMTNTKFLIRNLFDNESEEDFFVWKSEVISGILDKNQYNFDGLVQIFNEFFGDKYSGYLLLAISRLLIHYFRLSGFSCGTDDMVLNHSIEIIRACFFRHTKSLAIHSFAEMIDRQVCACNQNSRNKVDRFQSIFSF
jgi:DNA-directed RNA polymerase I subunit RPA1